MVEERLTDSLALVKRAQAGESDALNRLFARYHDRVLRVVRVRLGRGLRSVLESSDILQDTFENAVRAFDSFEVRDEASLIHWLAKLAQNQIHAAADRYDAKKRDRRREANVIDRDDGEGRFEPAAPALSAVEALAVDEEEALVEECVHELPDGLRELILLRNYTGASWQTVAELTGRPSDDSARAMHARAMNELGKLLRARGVEG